MICFTPGTQRRKPTDRNRPPDRPFFALSSCCFKSSSNFQTCIFRLSSFLPSLRSFSFLHRTKDVKSCQRFALLILCLTFMFVSPPAMQSPIRAPRKHFLLRNKRFQTREVDQKPTSLGTFLGAIPGFYLQRRSFDQRRSRQRSRATSFSWRKEKTHGTAAAAPPALSSLMVCSRTASKLKGSNVKN